ncbi:tetratricopeptide repeat protein [Synechococcus sp. PCC 7336]|uniref:tetratricopeptide repeat protein n=1 Tax=Synechococcus sp. PCC 7336 TaxID=195250 RepID=UPI0003812E1C|nr:tetratricopeptide repeat protein [Synechococcus sp. PCC 7336]
MNNSKGFRRKIKDKREEFDREWMQAVERFKIVVGFKSFSLKLKHPKTHKLAKPHIAIPEIFKEWQGIESLWDRRSLMFEVLNGLLAQHMKPWQTANYLTANRNPLEALNILENSIKENIHDEDWTESCAALAKTLIALTYYKDALQWAQRSSQANPENFRFQVILADAYFLCNYYDEANAIYKELISGVASSNSNSVFEIFSDFFMIEKGVIPSPIFALRIGENLSDPAQIWDFWKLAEAEFYDNPYFRVQHSYYLAKSGFLQRSFSKLLALVQEMPWLREASLNLMKIFEYFEQSENEVMPDFKAKLKQRIEEQGWTFEGIEELEINP